MYKQCAFTRLKECKYDIWTDNNKSFYFLMKHSGFNILGLAPFQLKLHLYRVDKVLIKFN